jgi:putative glutamine amidotransferase
MDGLLLTGGTDIHPSRYGHPDAGSQGVEHDRDALEAEAWEAALERGVPVLGICRGFQAINVFSGGTLLQHVDGHAGPGWGDGPAATHALTLVPGTRLAAILTDGAAVVDGGADDPDPVVGAARARAVDPGDPVDLIVNTYHHQAVRAGDLADGLVAAAWAPSDAGDLVEGFEAADGRFVVGVQCHPERTESTPASFERLWAAFVDACQASGPG